MKQLKDTFPANHAVVQMDYSENWSTSFMHEIQSAFYGKDQITLHPMVVYVRKDEEVKAMSFVGVSKVTAHSFPTTLAFLTQLLGEIKQEVTDLQHLHIVTDSPSSQYRNRYACDLLMKAKSMFDIRITWNWLEAGHGKGPCDGVGGALKGLADRVVKSCGDIQTAEDFCDQIRPQTNKIKLLLTSEPEVVECAQLVASWKSRPVNGLMSIHQATVHQDELYLRPTSCYATECCMGEDLIPVCDDWKKAGQRKTRPSRPAAAPVIEHESSTSRTSRTKTSMT